MNTSSWIDDWYNSINTLGVRVWDNRSRNEPADTVDFYEMMIGVND